MKTAKGVPMSTGGVKKVSGLACSRNTEPGANVPMGKDAFKKTGTGQLPDQPYTEKFHSTTRLNNRQ